MPTIISKEEYGNIFGGLQSNDAEEISSNPFSIERKPLPSALVAPKKDQVEDVATPLSTSPGFRDTLGLTADLLGDPINRLRDRAADAFDPRHSAPITNALSPLFSPPPTDPREAAALGLPSSTDVVTGAIKDRNQQLGLDAPLGEPVDPATVESFTPSIDDMTPEALEAAQDLRSRYKGFKKEQAFNYLKNAPPSQQTVEDFTAGEVFQRDGGFPLMNIGNAYKKLGDLYAYGILTSPVGALGTEKLLGIDQQEQLASQDLLHPGSFGEEILSSVFRLATIDLPLIVTTSKLGQGALSTGSRALGFGAQAGRAAGLSGVPLNPSIAAEGFNTLPGLLEFLASKGVNPSLIEIAGSTSGFAGLEASNELAHQLSEAGRVSDPRELLEAAGLGAFLGGAIGATNRWTEAVIKAKQKLGALPRNDEIALRSLGFLGEVGILTTPALPSLDLEQVAETGKHNLILIGMLKIPGLMSARLQRRGFTEETAKALEEAYQQMLKEADPGNVGLRDVVKSEAQRAAESRQIARRSDPSNVGLKEPVRSEAQRAIIDEQTRQQELRGTDPGNVGLRAPVSSEAQRSAQDSDVVLGRPGREADRGVESREALTPSPESPRVEQRRVDEALAGVEADPLAASARLRQVIEDVRAEGGTPSSDPRVAEARQRVREAEDALLRQSELAEEGQAAPRRPGEGKSPVSGKARQTLEEQQAAIDARPRETESPGEVKVDTEGLRDLNREPTPPPGGYARPADAPARQERSQETARQRKLAGIKERAQAKREEAAAKQTAAAERTAERQTNRQRFLEAARKKREGKAARRGRRIVGEVDLQRAREVGKNALETTSLEDIKRAERQDRRKARLGAKAEAERLEAPNTKRARERNVAKGEREGIEIARRVKAEKEGKKLEDVSLTPAEIKEAKRKGRELHEAKTEPQAPGSKSDPLAKNVGKTTGRPIERTIAEQSSAALGVSTAKQQLLAARTRGSRQEILRLLNPKARAEMLKDQKLPKEVRELIEAQSPVNLVRGMHRRVLDNLREVARKQSNKHIDDFVDRLERQAGQDSYKGENKAVRKELAELDRVLESADFESLIKAGFFDVQLGKPTRAGAIKSLATIRKLIKEAEDIQLPSKAIEKGFRRLERENTLEEGRRFDKNESPTEITLEFLKTAERELDNIVKRGKWRAPKPPAKAEINPKSAEEAVRKGEERAKQLDAVDDMLRLVGKGKDNLPAPAAIFGPKETVTKGFSEELFKDNRAGETLRKSMVGTIELQNKGTASIYGGGASKKVLNRLEKGFLDHNGPIKRWLKEHGNIGQKVARDIQLGLGINVAAQTRIKEYGHAVLRGLTPQNVKDLSYVLNLENIIAISQRKITSKNLRFTEDLLKDNRLWKDSELSEWIVEHKLDTRGKSVDALSRQEMIDIALGVKRTAGEELYDSKGRLTISGDKFTPGNIMPFHNPGKITLKEALALRDKMQKDNPEYYAMLKERMDAHVAQTNKELAVTYNDGRITLDTYEQLTERPYVPRELLKYTDIEGFKIETQSLRQQKVEAGDSGVGLLQGGSKDLINMDFITLTERHIANNRALHFHNMINKGMKDLVTSKEHAKKMNELGFEVLDFHPKDAKAVPFYEGGVRKWLKMPDEIYRDWVVSEPIMTLQASTALGYVTGATPLRFFATGANPAFAIPALMRDVGYFWMRTNMYSPIAPIGMVQLIKDLGTRRVLEAAFLRTKSEFYTKAMEEGIGMNFLTHTADRGQLIDSLSSKAGSPLNRARIRNSLTSLRDVLGYLNESMEIWIRMAMMHRAQKHLGPNVDFRDAVFAAREPIDFSVGGHWIKAVDRGLIPYTNVMAQSTYGLAKAVHANPAVASFKIAQLISMGIGLGLANRAVNLDAWQLVPEETKARNMVFTLPVGPLDKEGNRRFYYFAIPMDQGQALFFRLGDFMASRYTGLNDVGMADFRASMDSAFSTGWDSLIPPMAAAMLAYNGNYDTFSKDTIWRGGPTEKASEEYYQHTDSFKVNLHKNLEEYAGLDLSPVRTDAALRKLALGNNAWVHAVGGGLKALFYDMPAEERDNLEVEFFAKRSVPGVSAIGGRFIKLTSPGGRGDTELRQQVAAKFNSDRLAQNRLFDKITDSVPPGSKRMTPKARREVKSLIREMDQRDRRRMITMAKEWEEIARFVPHTEARGRDAATPRWYLNVLTHSNPQERAHVFYGLTRHMPKDEQKRRLKVLARIRNSGTFMSTYRRLVKGDELFVGDE